VYRQAMGLTLDMIRTLRNESNSEICGAKVKCLLSLTVGLEFCISDSHLASGECDLFLVHDCSCCLL
jgi:hypothetical protein